MNLDLEISYNQPFCDAYYPTSGDLMETSQEVNIQKQAMRERVELA